MNIFMLSAEVFPFAKTGGLADAVSSLSSALRRNGECVKILLPRYYSIPREKLEPVARGVFVSLGPSEERADFYRTRLPGSGVEVYFVDCDKFFGRDGFYGPSADSEYPDNILRFSFFARSLFSLCETLNFFPDIIHCHDWSSALAPVLLKFQEREKKPFMGTKSVFTIHNAGYQGIFPREAFRFTGLSEELFTKAGFEHFGSVNFLKAAASASDKITTVSPNYAREIQRAEYGFGLDGLYRVRADDLSGIVNGIDCSEWNPETDGKIPANFSCKSEKSMRGKKECKKELQKFFALPEKPGVPVVSMITRLASQKGIGEVFAPMYGAAWRICTELDVQFVAVGSGEAWCENEMRVLEKKLPNFRAYIGYNDALSHLVEAGSDFFLMPSKYEPCGLNQIYSMLYGTLPVVRNTGGLHDTVKNYSESDLSGTGFVFDDLTPDAIFGTLKWAVETYFNRPSHMKVLVHNAMDQDFSWEKSALEYLEVYRSALKMGRN